MTSRHNTSDCFSRTNSTQSNGDGWLGIDENDMQLDYEDVLRLNRELKQKAQYYKNAWEDIFTMMEEDKKQYAALYGDREKYHQLAFELEKKSLGLEETLTVCQGEHERAKEKIEKLRAENLELKRVHEFTKKQNADVVKSHAAVVRDKTVVEGEVASLRVGNSLLMQQISELQENNASLLREKEALHSKSLETIQGLRDMVQEKSQSVENLEKRERDLIRERDDLSAQKWETEDQKARLEAKIQTIQEDHKGAEAQMLQQFKQLKREASTYQSTLAKAAVIMTSDSDITNLARIKSDIEKLQREFAKFAATKGRHVKLDHDAAAALFDSYSPLKTRDKSLLSAAIQRRALETIIKGVSNGADWRKDRQDENRQGRPRYEIPPQSDRCSDIANDEDGDCLLEFEIVSTIDKLLDLLGRFCHSRVRCDDEISKSTPEKIRQQVFSLLSAYGLKENNSFIRHLAVKLTEDVEQFRVMINDTYHKKISDAEKLVYQAVRIFYFRMRAHGIRNITFFEGDTALDCGIMECIGEEDTISRIAVCCFPLLETRTSRGITSILYKAQVILQPDGFGKIGSNRRREGAQMQQLHVWCPLAAAAERISQDLVRAEEQSASLGKESARLRQSLEKRLHETERSLCESEKKLCESEKNLSEARQQRYVAESGSRNLLERFETLNQWLTSEYYDQRSPLYKKRNVSNILNIEPPRQYNTKPSPHVTQARKIDMSSHRTRSRDSSGRNADKKEGHPHNRR